MVECRKCCEMVIESDICGNECVHCAGVTLDESKRVDDGWICKECGEHTKSLSNDMCFDCYTKYRTLGSKCDVCGEHSWEGKYCVSTGVNTEIHVCKSCYADYK